MSCADSVNAVVDECLRDFGKVAILHDNVGIPKPGGAIVNVSAIASIRQVGYSCMAYGASKAAVNQLTQSIAIEYADKGIRANTILLGLMHAGY